MENGVSVVERLTTDMTNGDVVQTLYETTAHLFEVDVATLNDNTRFADLANYDAHIMEELRTNFEDALRANRTDGKLELIIEDFNTADTLGDLLDVIRTSQIL